MWELYQAGWWKYIIARYSTGNFECDVVLSKDTDNEVRWIAFDLEGRRITTGTDVETVKTAVSNKYPIRQKKRSSQVA